tara:strand:+ start:5673 stop:6215 length:543 start_codon:yes stop_codon:yes gene_type:complete
VVDDCARECLTLVADTSLSALQVTRELDAIIARRGKPNEFAMKMVLETRAAYDQKSTQGLSGGNLGLRSVSRQPPACGAALMISQPLAAQLFSYAQRSPSLAGTGKVSRGLAAAATTAARDGDQGRRPGTATRDGGAASDGAQFCDSPRRAQRACSANCAPTERNAPPQAVVTIERMLPG